ncbi:MAG: hypothetical protein LBQ47_01970 [Endomicrobium sp.]|jgi:hypothetical protein|nr:hypothetical protein [Endomicrobium sp.]
MNICCNGSETWTGLYFICNNQFNDTFKKIRFSLDVKNKPIFINEIGVGDIQESCFIRSLNQKIDVGYYSYEINLQNNDFSAIENKKKTKFNITLKELLAF